MFPSIPSDPAQSSAQPLPPLPDLNTKPGSGKSGDSTDPFASTMNKIKPISDAVNEIHTSIAKIARTGVIPLSGVLDQLSALVSSLVPMAAQTMLMPGGSSGALPPPSGAPPDLGGGSPGPVSPGPPPSGPPSSPGGPGV